MAETGFARPTLATLIDRISGDLNAQLGNVDARVPRTVPYVFARVLAGAVHLVYGFAASIARQILPDTASGDYLARLGGVWGVTRKPATRANDGAVELSGAPGTVIPINTLLRRVDGVQYATSAQVVIAGGGTAHAPAAATAPGKAGNASSSTALSLVSPIAGASSSATVSTPFTNGLDDETDDELRARILERISRPPQGGSVADYRQWAMATPSVEVRDVYVTPQGAGPGTVVVRFSVVGDGAAAIPSGGAVAAVQAQIDGLRPVTADVTVAAPTGRAITMTIAVVPSTAEVKAAVVAELNALFAREAKPGGTIKNSNIREAISSADGETSHALILLAGGSPTADIVQGATELAYLSTVTWA